MMFLKTYLRWLAGPLAVVMFLTTSGFGVAQAGMIATDDVAQSELAAADRAMLLDAVDRADVRNQLTALGISPDEATDRINAMSNAELAQVMDQFNDMPAGESAVGFVVGIVLIVLIVFLVTDAFEVTDVY